MHLFGFILAIALNNTISHGPILPVVHSKRKTLKILDTEREEMKLTWIDSITQQ